MRKIYSILILVVLGLIMFSTTGCNFSFNGEKDLQLGKMEEQIKTLRLDNARLKKEVVKTEIIDTGTDITFTTLTGVFIVTNNLIWWVIARRKRDEINEVI